MPRPARPAYIHCLAGSIFRSGGAMAVQVGETQGLGCATHSCWGEGAGPGWGAPRLAVPSPSDAHQTLAAGLQGQSFPLELLLGRLSLSPPPVMGTFGGTWSRGGSHPGDAWLRQGWRGERRPQPHRALSPCSLSSVRSLLCRRPGPWLEPDGPGTGRLWRGQVRDTAVPSWASGRECRALGCFV